VGAGSIILSEFLGTMVLLLFGCGVVANVLLTRTNADGDTASWVLITFGWGFGVFAGASAAEAESIVRSARRMWAGIYRGLRWPSRRSMRSRIHAIVLT